MKIALIHDDLIQHGGAERVFKVLVGIFPNADIFTSVLSRDYESRFTNYELRSSFMQKFPFKKKIYRAYFSFYPLAFESFDLSEYDLVVSSSSRFAHGIITRPETTHICYMHSPGRMWWEPGSYFGIENPKRSAVETLHATSLQLKILSPFLSWLRQWDYVAAQRVDYFIANSNSVKARIEKFYGRESTVIYPFVNLRRFDSQINSNAERIDTNLYTVPADSSKKKESCLTDKLSGCPTDFFLIVSRLVRWKRFDIVIKACNKLKQPLVVVGEGPDRKRLKKMAGPTVTFLGRLSDEDVVKCFKACKALVFPQKEDFGITPLEAMAAGKPVIAYKAGGALETVLPGDTGEFFYPQTVRAVADAISNFDSRRFRADVCREQAAKFSEERFDRRIREFIERVL